MMQNLSPQDTIIMYKHKDIKIKERKGKILIKEIFFEIL